MCIEVSNTKGTHFETVFLTIIELERLVDVRRSTLLAVADDHVVVAT